MAGAPPRARVRLNLLPPEIPAARRAKRLLPLCIIPILGAVILSLLWMAMWKKAVKDHTDAKDALSAIAAEVDKLDQDIAAEQQKQEPLRAILAFLDGVEVHTSPSADVIEAVARYIPDTCTIDGITVTESTVSFNTVVEDTEALILLIANLNRCAMPMEGGGTEPLWTADTVSAGDLKPRFRSPGPVVGNGLQGLRLEEPCPSPRSRPRRRRPEGLWGLWARAPRRRLRAAVTPRSPVKRKRQRAAAEQAKRSNPGISAEPPCDS